MNELRKFHERTVTELNLSLNEVEWWNDLVRRGIIKAEHAQGYIDTENRIIKIKRDVLGLS
jgi:hypothetical protein